MQTVIFSSLSNSVYSSSPDKESSPPATTPAAQLQAHGLFSCLFAAPPADSLAADAKPISSHFNLTKCSPTLVSKFFSPRT